MRWGWDYNREDDFNDRSICISDNSSIDMDKAIRLSVLPAKGGCVLETRIFDKKTHDWTTEAHIIPDSEDVAHRIGQIVALEMLKR